MTKRFRRRRSEEGFTLFELLIVIVILAIIAGIVVFSVGSSTANAATTACQTDARAILAAVEEYKAAVGVYPGDESLQYPQGPLNPSPTPLPTYGQTWNILGYQLPGTYGLLGDVGDPSSPDATWVDPDGDTIGPFLRQLPSQNHYRIVTDGEGNVYVYPPDGIGHIPFQGPTMIGQTVFSVLGISSDHNLLDFTQDPEICSDPNVVR